MSNEISGESFENLSYEDRTFAPSQSFIDNANTKSDTYDLVINLSSILLVEAISALSANYH